MGTLLNRRRYMGGGYNFPYITDGLIDMWDAEWNAGFMEHSANATTWKDLGSAGKDLTMRSGEGYYYWDGNRLRCEGQGYVAYLSEMYNNFQTIECVFSVDDIEHDGLDRMQMLVWAQQTKGIMITAYREPPKTGVEFGLYNKLGSSIYIGDSYSEVNEKIYNVSGVYWDNNSTRVSRAYSNGVQGSLYNADNGAGGDFFTIGGQTSGNRLVKGYIYTIRLYNRALSADEISQNWLVDNTRFNISQQ